MFIINTAKEFALPLQPLIFWDECPNHPDVLAGHCYLFDKSNADTTSFIFKATGYPCAITISVSEADKYTEVATALLALKGSDPKIEPAKNIKLREINVD